MKHTLYSKLLISYLIYGVIAFFIICTFTQHLTTDYIEKHEASNLYREASIIAGDYASEYFGSSMSLSDFQNHMKIVADYMDAEVWDLARSKDMADNRMFNQQHGYYADR